jgi:molybdopterin molybdotransferase
LNADAPLMTVVLGKNVTFTPSLTYFLQVEVKSENGEMIAYPEAGGGSGDFVNLKNITGFIELPADRSSFQAGEVFLYFPFRNFS